MTDNQALLWHSLNMKLCCLVWPILNLHKHDLPIKLYILLFTVVTIDSFSIHDNKNISILFRQLPKNAVIFIIFVLMLHTSTAIHDDNNKQFAPRIWHDSVHQYYPCFFYTHDNKLMCAINNADSWSKLNKYFSAHKCYNKTIFGVTYKALDCNMSPFWVQEETSTHILVILCHNISGCSLFVMMLQQKVIQKTC